MEYEELLDFAYKKIGKMEICNRFEVKKPAVIYEGTNKTIIVNFMQIVLCLRRNQDHVTRFLSKNLAAYGEVAGDRFILGRKISIDMIEKKIDLYLNEYVICPKCEKPDTEILEEGGNSYLRCLACGARVNVHKI